MLGSLDFLLHAVLPLLRPPSVFLPHLSYPLDNAFHLHMLSLASAMFALYNTVRTHACSQLLGRVTSLSGTTCLRAPKTPPSSPLPRRRHMVLAGTCLRSRLSTSWGPQLSIPPAADISLIFVSVQRGLHSGFLVAVLLHLTIIPCLGSKSTPAPLQSLLPS